MTGPYGDKGERGKDGLPGTPGTKFANTMGAILFRGQHKGQEILVSVGGGYTEQQRDEFWAHRDQLVGVIGEVEADAVTKSQNSDVYSLRFPRFVRLRGWEPGEKI